MLKYVTMQKIYALLRFVGSLVVDFALLKRDNITLWLILFR